MAAQQRPLSPHLQIYKQKLTGTLSILHRGTGMLLAVAAFALAAWLLSVAGGSDAFASFKDCAGSALGQAALLAVVASLAYHLFNGIRHLLWDIGWGFELPQVYASGWTVVALALLTTALVAWLALRAGGAA
jgi:succinate dehydrogenase / fumarate reductase cytochrome b subunit